MGDNSKQIHLESLEVLDEYIKQLNLHASHLQSLLKDIELYHNALDDDWDDIHHKEFGECLSDINQKINTALEAIENEGVGSLKRLQEQYADVGIS